MFRVSYVSWIQHRLQPWLEVTQESDDDDEVAQQRHYYWSLKDIPRFEGREGEKPFLHLMEFEDYLVASGVSIEPQGGKRY